MKPNRSLLAVAYIMVLVMMLIPLGEALLSVVPFRASETAWRFGAVGMVSRAMMTPLLGLVLLGAIGLATQRRWVMITTGVLALIATLVLIATELMFVLDAIQMRAMVRMEARTAFDAASLLALAKLLISTVVTALLAFGAWGTTRAARQPVADDRPNTSLIMSRLRDDAEPGVAATSPDSGA